MTDEDFCNNIEEPLARLQCFLNDLKCPEDLDPTEFDNKKDEAIFECIKLDQKLKKMFTGMYD